MAQWGSCSLKQSKGNMQTTSNEEQLNDKTQDERGMHSFFSLSLSSPVSSDSPRKWSAHQNNKMQRSKNGGVQKSLKLPTHTEW